MTGPRCLCPPPFVREPGRHLVGCPHAPGDTVAPARPLLERPPVDDPAAGDPTDVGTREQHRAELAAGRDLLGQATGVDEPGDFEAFLRDAWRTIHAASLEAETRTVHPDRAAAERLGRVFDLPLPAFAPELCTPAELEAWRARVEAGRRTVRGRALRARRWLATGPVGRVRQRARFARFDLVDALTRRWHR